MNNLQRDISTLPLPEQIQLKLKSTGFSTVENLLQLSPTELCGIAQLTPEEVVEIFKFISSENENTSDSSDIISLSALDLLLEEYSNTPITTFSKAVDDILGGGIPLKKLTEVCGLPGAGKTQLCLQLCINVQLPKECGGLDGEAIYIDTEGSFSVDRLYEMAEASVRTCSKILRGAGQQTNNILFTPDKIIAGVYYFFCKDYLELIAASKFLPDFLQAHPKVHLLVIDSIAFHFRYGFEDDCVKRNRLLNKLSQSFLQMTQKFPLAVLLTNQMTTHVINETGCSQIVPALGKSWGHTCTIRIILTYDEYKRQATLFKSPYREDAVADYEITASGIRDHIPISDNPSTNASEISSITLQRNKRPRTETGT